MGVQEAAGFGLTAGFGDVAMAGVAMVVLVGAAVGWRRLGMTGLVGRYVGDEVDAVACRERSGGWRAGVHTRGGDGGSAVDTNSCPSSR